MTRLRQLLDKGQEVPLPPVAAEYLVDWWLEIGPAGADGPVSWHEMEAWQAFRVPLEPWEAQCIRKMSAAFIEMQREARDPACPPPWSDEPIEARRARVTDQFAALARVFAAKGKTGD